MNSWPNFFENETTQPLQIQSLMVGGWMSVEREKVKVKPYFSLHCT